jgi:hypothetical protein
MTGIFAVYDVAGSGLAGSGFTTKKPAVRCAAFNQAARPASLNVPDHDNIICGTSGSP